MLLSLDVSFWVCALGVRLGCAFGASVLCVHFGCVIWVCVLGVSLVRVFGVCILGVHFGSVHWVCVVGASFCCEFWVCFFRECFGSTFYVWFECEFWGEVECAFCVCVLNLF